MPKPNPFLERAPAIQACAQATALIRALNDDTLLPTRQYNRTSNTRRARWLELASLAEQQAQRTVEATPKRAKASKPRVVATTPIGEGVSTVAQ
jgi:hypothetical protein